MKIIIKEFVVDMEVKSSGIEFEVRTPDNKKQLGDCYITKTGMIWCEGRKGKNNGIKISWDEFIQIMQSDDTKKKAIKSSAS